MKTGRTVGPAFLASLAFALSLPFGAQANGLEAIDQLPPFPPALRTALDGVRGKAVMVNFWASWCGPCRDEMPALVELDEAEPGMVLITVAVADRAADTRRFLDDHLLDTLVVIADHDQAISRQWGVRTIPTTYVLNTSHQPRLRVRGEADWRDAAVRTRVLKAAGIDTRMNSN
ncbi:thiol:disulfide oxidoreductase [Parazoarcus communis]|uniref:Thiol:disulfide oxidoreductase n=1 Tax=Parazoarcus communis TaxID=41977 RepID=A0A2U8GZQ7_9RHOO|nr:TlpA disulfide reductase family protein [Parazoarcus communis]AWI78944.1 thiol:disulfide oxidoreductase [Parazoarcus communis]